ncbi:hypothetical protein KSP39_PZI010692 [Platanthera zijinensis]|uniref:Uncharacterized protein n=1 Tax=Platanthera zijinensis TaxID=2320716 RepID=A0AAP0BKI7_9ASPA
MTQIWHLAPAHSRNRLLATEGLQGNTSGYSDIPEILPNVGLGFKASHGGSNDACTSNP